MEWLASFSSLGGVMYLHSTIRQISTHDFCPLFNSITALLSCDGLFYIQVPYEMYDW